MPSIDAVDKYNHQELYKTARKPGSIPRRAAHFVETSCIETENDRLTAQSAELTINN
jgi:hypothetical protein